MEPESYVFPLGLVGQDITVGEDPVRFAETCVEALQGQSLDANVVVAHEELSVLRDGCNEGIQESLGCVGCLIESGNGGIALELDHLSQ